MEDFNLSEQPENNEQKGYRLPPAHQEMSGDTAKGVQSESWVDQSVHNRAEGDVKSLMPLARMDVLKGSTPLGYFVIDSPGIDQASIIALLTEGDKGRILLRAWYGWLSTEVGFTA